MLKRRSNNPNSTGFCGFKRNTILTLVLLVFMITCIMYSKNHIIYSNVTGTSDQPLGLSLVVASTYQDYTCFSSRFFDIIYNQITEPPDEVIIVVSGTPADIKSLEAPPPSPLSPLRWRPSSVRVVHFHSPKTAGMNRNIGANIARGDVVTFFDIDDVPHPQRFQLIRHFFNQHASTVDAALFPYVNGSFLESQEYVFEPIPQLQHNNDHSSRNPHSLLEYYDMKQLHKAYARAWEEKKYRNYSDLWCCGVVNRYLANGWGTYKRSLFLQYQYRETLDQGEDSDLNARMILDGQNFTFWDSKDAVPLGFYVLYKGGWNNHAWKTNAAATWTECPLARGYRVPGKEEIEEEEYSTSTAAAPAILSCRPTPPPRLPPPHISRQRRNAYHPILFNGCGYSGTGFLSQVFMSAGYDIRHECMGRLGTSDWRYSFYNTTTHPLTFNHIYVQVRHPLDVVASWYSEKWDFTVDWKWYKDCGLPQPQGLDHAKFDDIILDVRKYFSFDIFPKAKKLHVPSLQLQALEWWYQANSRAIAHAECWWRVKDFNADMAISLCLRAGLEDCFTKDWVNAIDQRKNYNSHRAKNESAPVPTWEGLCGRQDDPYRICLRARKLCQEFGFENC